MEKLVSQGLVTSIGVANFSTMLLFDLLSFAQTKPVMNQIELHPYNVQAELVKFCQANEIAVTAYSPLGSPGGMREGDPNLMQDAELVKIAKRHNKTVAQVLLNWAVQRNTIPIPKSTDKKRIIENMNSFDFQLTQDDLLQITSLDRKYRYVNPIGWWGVPYFS